MTELISGVASATTSLSKARIINLESKNSEQIECLFNPSEYSVTKQNRWVEGKNSGRDTLDLEFASGQPETLKLQLFFDTYAERKDVRAAYTQKIWELMKVDGELMNTKTKKGRPPLVLFQWGGTGPWTFTAVITGITQKFTLFLPDGTPVRATLDVTFQQAKDKRERPAQNPTSGGEGGSRVWTVVAGDTLAWIAYMSYGDATRWRPIADANRLASVRRLNPGDTLVIPNA